MNLPSESGYKGSGTVPGSGCSVANGVMTFLQRTMEAAASARAYLKKGSDPLNSRGLTPFSDRLLVVILAINDRRCTSRKLAEKEKSVGDGQSAHLAEHLLDGQRRFILGHMSHIATQIANVF